MRTGVLTCLSLPPQTAEQAFRQIQSIVDYSSNVMSSLLGQKFIHSGVNTPFMLCSTLKNVQFDCRPSGWTFSLVSK